VATYGRCLCGSLAVGLLSLQRCRGKARVAFTEGGETSVLTSQIGEDVLAGRRVKEEDRRPLAHGLRPLAVLCLGIIP